MDVWMDGPWCHCFVGWIFGFAVFGERFCQLFVVLETNDREEDNRASKV
jgi:hypothetical protein